MEKDISRKIPTIIGGEFAIDIEALKKVPEILPAKSSYTEKASNDNLFFFSSGRAALYAALQAESKDGYLKLVIPDYLCKSVADTAIDCRIDFCFYHILDNLYPDMEKMFEALQSNDKATDSKHKIAIILINYFGLLDLEDIIKTIRLKAPDTIIILDDVQNFYGFNMESDFDYAFTSLRKWFPLPDGGILKIGTRRSENGRPSILPVIDKMTDRNLFVSYKLAGNSLKNYRQLIQDEVYLELIDKGEKLLDQNYKCMISDISYYLFDTYVKENMKKIQEIRKENAKILHEELEKRGIYHIYAKERTPLFVPIFVDATKRDAIRSKMFEKNIYCPIHWKSFTLPNGNHISGKLYDTQISLICDQRYSGEDMKKILRTI